MSNMDEMEITEDGVCIGNFRAYGVREGKYGVALILNDEVCESVGVFTKNKVNGASVPIDKEKLKRGGIRAVIANSGNANCCTKTALEDAKRMCEIAGEKLGIDADSILVASTGIIGKKLDVLKIKELVDKIDREHEGSSNASKAIMTTDTYPKQISVNYRGIKIGGVAKGAGMIAPDLATMLCFLTTNADFGKEELQTALENAVEDSFNMLSVDGDMSTNDTVILMSNRSHECKFEDFCYALNFVARELAKLIAKDGEGATKFLEIEVKNAKSRENARKGARAIISSPLVKTAIFGENPNWGRIVSALGSVIEVDFDKIDIIFSNDKDKTKVVEKGVTGDLEKAHEILKSREIRIVVNLHDGDENAVAYGCDLTYSYVKINAEYN